MHRRILYKTVIERMMVHGAAVWCLNRAVHMARKFSSIQRPFLLAISGAYRTTPTAGLQIMLGIPPLNLQLQAGARMTVLYRLRRQINDIIIQPDDLESRKVGWSRHPSNYLTQEQLQLEDGGKNHTRLFTDGSKTPNGVGAAFCVMEDEGDRTSVVFKTQTRKHRLPSRASSS
ncbi:hypothetical protein AVEN_229369-1 [Araneus ventricosus]|uniref:RNase H type-1 domain-containing protein n=1 Tax=Araneus ventricosus TaxID=182803 RepID=A0A4Y2I1U0_ARAVE|nr:hypothetical protein AVEN_229369-1 [Araneus ventricosus]